MAMNKVMMATAVKNNMATVDPTAYDLTTLAGNSAYRQALLEEFCDAVIKHIQSEAEIIIAGAFSAGVAVPNDGGAALKTAWSTQPNLSGAIQ